MSTDRVPTCKPLEPIPDRLVVLTFDDGCRSDADVVVPLLKAYGFGATFYVNDPAYTPDGWKPENYLTWAQVRAIHEAGFEIGNHTRGHPAVTALSREAFIDELEHIEGGCRENGIPCPVTFCYPGFIFGREAVSVLAGKAYRFARRGPFPEVPPAGSGARGIAYDPARHHPLLVPVTGYSGPDWGMDDLVWAVEQARPSTGLGTGDGQIAVLNFHGVPDVEHPWVHTDPGVFREYMDVLRDRACTVIAMRDLARYVDPAAGPEDPFAVFAGTEETGDAT